MSDGRDNSIRSAAIGLTAGLVVVALAVGFLLLPMVEGRAKLQGLWDTICSAAGVIRNEPAREAVVPAPTRGTDVVLTQQIVPPASPQSIGHGATLALRCTMCHGARGLSEADSPNLAGQYAAMVYKQLRDYKSGARVNAVMTPLAAGLSDVDMRDLAAYYAYLPRVPAERPLSEDPPAIVVSGAPMRNIAPCGACHGGPDNKAGSAWLEGQSEVYLLAQLRAFATGARRNDISAQMRNIARRMTPAEMQAAARYYASRP